jgi:hypothetical protein
MYSLSLGTSMGQGLGTVAEGLWLTTAVMHLLCLPACLPACSFACLLICLPGCSGMHACIHAGYLHGACAMFVVMLAMANFVVAQAVAGRPYGCVVAAELWLAS